MFLGPLECIIIAFAVMEYMNQIKGLHNRGLAYLLQDENTTYTTSNTD